MIVTKEKTSGINHRNIHVGLFVCFVLSSPTPERFAAVVESNTRVNQTARGIGGEADRDTLADARVGVVVDNACAAEGRELDGTI
mmetsp:Transcript_3832/g.10063  ORF Transcript_3832/g.10063 Transcript_3832/m.10063 type:complete len:85 (-) Transcript_3832:2264-2518(-)